MSDNTLSLLFYYRRELFPNNMPERTLDEVTDRYQRIRCPQCGWQPEKTSRWFCGDCGPPEYFFGGCGTCWNTFATGGTCPGCRHRWRWTSCLSCTKWSRHRDWYTKEK